MVLTRISLFVAIALLSVTKIEAQEGWKQRTPEFQSILLNSIAGTTSQIVVAGYIGAYGSSTAYETNGVYLTSPDGVIWSQTSLNSQEYLFSILWVGGQFIALSNDVNGNGFANLSKDGKKWTRVNISKANNLIKICGSGTRLLAIDESGTIYTSEKGFDWSIKKVSGLFERIKDLKWTGSIFLAEGVYYEPGGVESQIYFASEDGLKWSKVEYEFFENNGNTSTTAQPKVEQLPGGSSEPIWTGNQFLSIQDGRYILASKDGKNWSIVFDQTPPNSLIAAASFGDRNVVVGDDGTIRSSLGGIEWVTCLSGTKLGLNSITWGNKQFLAVGKFGIIMSSYDGLHWNQMPSISSIDLKSVIWTGTQFVAVGQKGEIITSPNGTVWTKRVSTTVENLNSVVWGNNLIVVCGGNSTLLTSLDGVLWTSQKHAKIKKFLKSLIWTGTKFYGTEKTSSYGTSTNIFSSSDGINWSSDSNSVFRFQISSMAWTGSQIIAVGSSQKSSRSTPFRAGQVFTSIHGKTWESKALTLMDDKAITFIHWTGTQYISGGTLGRIFSTDKVPVTINLENVNANNNLRLRIMPSTLEIVFPPFLKGSTVNLRIMGLTGARVYATTLSSVQDGISVPTSRLTRGKYILEVQGWNQTFSKSFSIIQ